MKLTAHFGSVVAIHYGPTEGPGDNLGNVKTPIVFVRKIQVAPAPNESTTGDPA